MQNLTDFINKITGFNLELQKKIAILIVIIFILLLIRFITLKIIWYRAKDKKHHIIWKKTLTYLFNFLIIIMIFSFFLKDTKSIITFLTLIAAAIVISLRELISNIAGWIYILIQKPFTLGDRIQISNNAGDVIDKGIFQFTINEVRNWVDADQSTGRIIYIPNSKIFTDSLANYNKGFKYIWNEIPVFLTEGSNWKKAKTILLKIASKYSDKCCGKAKQKVKESSKKFMIYYNEFAANVYTEVREKGILLTIRYLCEPKKRRESTQSIWENILTEFPKHDDIRIKFS